MKTAPSQQKTRPAGEHSPQPHPSSGPEGLALVPPDYGLETLDESARAASGQKGGLALQRKAGPSAAGEAEGAPPKNRTGLPGPLKAGVEGLSGLSLDDVRVHYNSARPARLGALAYAQGGEIHVAPGQERHLPHEAWHVVQQKQGRVRATAQLRGVGLNDDGRLEEEATRMGAQANQAGAEGASPPLRASQSSQRPFPIVQRRHKVGFELEDADWRSWKRDFFAFKDPYWKSKADHRNVRPMTKRELLHQGTGFRLEADEFVSEGQLLSDIEFVTEPFPLTGAGETRVERALTEMAAIYSDIIPLRGREHSQGEFIRQDEHGFSENRVMLSKGASVAKLNVQATQGASLEELPRLYGAQQHRPQDTETPEASLYMQIAMTGTEDTQQSVVLRAVGEAPIRASRLAMAHLITELGEELPMAGRDKLLGLLTAAIGFVAFMRAPAAIAKGAKTFAAMMHRNDFATMFGLLPGPMQGAITGNRQTFVDAVIAGIVGDPAALDPLGGYDPEGNRRTPVFRRFIIEQDDRRRFFAGSEKKLELPNIEFLGNHTRKISYFVLPPTFTIAEWVSAWIDGVNPRDLLTKTHVTEALARPVTEIEDEALDPVLVELRNAMAPGLVQMIDWRRSESGAENTVNLAFRYDRLEAFQKEMLVDYLRGLGALGAQTDEEDPSLLLFENRAIAPEFSDAFETLHNPEGGAKLGVKAAIATVLAYFKGLRGTLGED